MRTLIALGLVTITACTAGTISTSGGDGGTPTPTPTASATDQTSPPEEKPDAATDPQPDAAPSIDTTPKFELTLEGDPVAIAKVTVKTTPASGSSAARLQIAGQYEQQLGSGLTSTATFTVSVNADAKGTDACGTEGRSGSYLFKDTDGAIRILDTGLLGGSCTMKVFGNASDGFTSGSATGVIGGAKQKPFTIAWGQPIPKS